MAIKISGVTIIDDSRNIVSGAAATFTSNVTIGGTLTYEDVTNIDSVGVITAREGISIPNLKGINLGDSNELNIINSNTSAFIQHSGSGYLFIHGNDIALRSQAQKNYIVCDSDNEVSLFFNGNEKKYLNELSSAEIAVGPIVKPPTCQWVTPFNKEPCGYTMI